MNSSYLSIKIKLLAAFIILCLLILGCSLSSHVAKQQAVAGAMQTEQQENQQNQVYMLQANADYAVASSVKHLVDYAQHIVIGQYGTFIEQLDSAGNIISDVYAFEIEEAYKGDLEGSIEVAIANYQIKRIEHLNKIYELKLELPNFTVPEQGKSYILFLGAERNNEPFRPAITPFQIMFDDADQAELPLRKIEQQPQLQISEHEYVAFESYDMNTPLEKGIPGRSKAELIEVIKQEILKQANE